MFWLLILAMIGTITTFTLTSTDHLSNDISQPKSGY